MDHANRAPRGDWRGDHEETRVERAVKSVKKAWRGDKPLHEPEDENKRLRRALGQTPGRTHAADETDTK